MIESKNLTKYYGDTVGINNLSFKLNKGNLYGFVGPNGAGKSTTIKTLLGFLFKDAGEAYINNLDITTHSHKIKEFTGYTPSDVRLYPNLKVKEIFEFNENFYKDKNSNLELERLVKLFDLDINKRFKELSTGNKKKVSLILAMVNNPKILIFDEPTNGLDPIIQERFFKELKSRTLDGVTILLSSHNLSEIEEYADHIIFIHEGEIIKEINSHNFEESKIVTITNGNLKYINKESIINKTDNKVTFRFKEDIKELLDLLDKVDPDDLVIENEKLSNYFKDIYEGENL